MTIPFVDLKSQYFSIKPEIDLAIKSVIEETAFIQGKHVEEFETRFSALYGIKHCISVANGTDSLYIIMKMLGIGPGDEVITAANSWISSSETITQTGALPVFADIDPTYYSIDETLIEGLITNKTKAIIPVHLQGQVCNMDAILKIATKYNLYIIEDCAQAHFSEFKSRRAGSFGIASSFSFYPGKNLGAYGDAGCVLTNDDELALKIRMYAKHGALKKHHHIIEGINSRMDGLQAAILSAKLPYILQWTEKRIEIAAHYSDRLKNVSDIALPETRPDSKHTFHLYVIRSQKREQLIKKLKERNIEVSIHYPKALPFLKAYDYLNHKPEDFKISWQYQDQILSLPIYPELSTDMVEYVCESIESAF